MKLKINKKRKKLKSHIVNQEQNILYTKFILIIKVKLFKL
jgi:hypothetical protein